MIRRFFTRIRNRDGQALVLCAIVFPLVLLFLAFVVDTAHAFVDQRHLQNTADAASLAAAQQLNGGGPGCASLADCATQYVSYNSGPTISGGTLQTCKDSSGNPITTYITQDMVDPQLKIRAAVISRRTLTIRASRLHQTVRLRPGTCADRVVVWLYECNPTFFGGILGISHVCVSVHSVSQGSTSPLLGTLTQPGFTTGPQTILSTSTSTIVNNGSTSYSTTVIPVTIKGTTTPGKTVTNTVTNTVPTTVTLPAHDNAMFAADMSCGSSNGIQFDKNNATVNGFIHSNGTISLTGNNNTIGGATYGQSGGQCGASGSTYNSLGLDASWNYTSPNPPIWPVPWPAPSTVCAGAHNVTTFPSAPYPGGTYCNLTGDLHVCDMPTSGKLTVVAQNITLDKTCNQRVLPDGNYQQTFPNGTFGLLFYATTGDVDIASNGDQFPADAFGFVFAPKGTITEEKNNGANGFWQALDIDIQFNNFSMTGFGPGGTPTPTPTTTVITSQVPSTITGTTVNDQTTQSTSVSTSTAAGSTSLIPTTSTTVHPGTTQDPVTQTVTTGVSTNLKLKQ